MSDPFTPCAGFGPVNWHSMPAVERIPESIQFGTAVIRCHLCNTTIRLDRDKLMADGATCKCGKLVVPARPDPIGANARRLKSRYGRAR